MTKPTPKLDRGAIVASVVSALIIVMAAVGGVLLIWSVRHELPAEVATHWGADGRPDAFKPVSGLIVENAIICGVIPLCLVVIGLVSKQGRLMGPIGAATAIFMSVVINGSIWAQRGMSAADVQQSDPTLSVLVGSAVAIVAGVGLALVFRKPKSTQVVAPSVGDDAPRLLVDDQVQLAWTGRTRVPTGAMVALGLGVVTTAIPMLLMAANRSWGMAAMMAALSALMVVLGMAMAATATVDSRGVRVRALGFITWMNVPLDTISGAGVKSVSPLGDFGGWGYRIGFNGEAGFVTASGPALRIDRGEEPAMVVTVPDAEAAAATLNTLVARRGQQPSQV